jgi:hypothetical protein
LNGDYQTTLALLQWLVNVTPTTGSTSQPAEDVAEWQALNQNAQTVLNQLQLGLNFYGQPYNYVPLVSYSFYSGALGGVNGLITIGTGIEDAYNNYMAAVGNQTQQQTQISSSLTQVNNHITALQSNCVFRHGAQHAVRRHQQCANRITGGNDEFGPCWLFAWRSADLSDQCAAYDS